jgi:hypothetical protein
MQAADTLWMIISFILTVLVLSFIIGDNPFFRLAVYLFVGVAAGYVAVMAIFQVLLPRLIYPFLQGNLGAAVLAVVPLIGSVLMFFKLSPRLWKLGNIPLAYLVGTGAAVMIGGVVLGTLVTQVTATINFFGVEQAAAAGLSLPLQLLEGGVILFGTVATLVYFQFSAQRKEGAEPQRPRWIGAIAKMGQVFIAVTMGALFAGVIAAALTALIDRLNFIWTFIVGWF